MTTKMFGATITEPYSSSAPASGAAHGPLSDHPLSRGLMRLVPSKMSNSSTPGNGSRALVSSYSAHHDTTQRPHMSRYFYGRLTTSLSLLMCMCRTTGLRTLSAWMLMSTTNAKVNATNAVGCHMADICPIAMLARYAQRITIGILGANSTRKNHSIDHWNWIPAHSGSR